MPNVRKSLKRAGRAISRGVKRVNRMRLSFKKKHPKIYNAGKQALYAGVADAAGVGPEYQAARGIYRAYKGRKRGALYHKANTFRTLASMGYAYYKRGVPASAVYSLS